MLAPEDRAFLRKTLVQLVRTDSVNPSLDADAPGEGAIALRVAARLRQSGLTTHRVESVPGRSSVVAVLPGTGGGPSLMLNGHIDTVGVDDMTAPFAAEIRGGKLYGRGAYDMKGAVAAGMTALRVLARDGGALRGDVLLAAVADEEFTSIGTEDVIRRFPVDAAIVLEPTQLRICLAHKGFAWLEVETQGRAAHGSRYLEGRDANMMMGHILGELAGLEASLRTGPAHPLVGPPTLHAALLKGGSGISTYAEHCRLQIERRTIPGETEALFVQQIQDRIDAAAERHPDLRASLRVTCVREPFEVDANKPVVRALAEAAESHLGQPPEMFGDTPWMDSALLAAAGIETVVFGPSGTGAHAAEEWVDLHSLEQLTEILVRTCRSYCA